MFDWFSSKPDPKEMDELSGIMDDFPLKPNVGPSRKEQRQVDRQLRKAGRDIERDRRQLEREEKKLELEIKKLAKEGNNEGVKMLAKQLVQLRKQKNRTYAANSKIQGIGVQNKMMGANAKLAESMGVAGKTMGEMNRIMNPEKMAANINAFTKESMKMDMTDEMINDTLDDILTESGDEEESDNIITQVLDEIGIEIGGKMSQAPAPERGAIGGTSKTKELTDEDIEAQLAKLKAI